MIEKYLKKHVEISLSNGEALYGFIDSIEEGFLNLIEQNNSEVMVKIDDISYVRVGNVADIRTDQKHYDVEEYSSAKHYSAQEEYSMPTPTPQDGPYTTPQFVRSTNK